MMHMERQFWLNNVRKIVYVDHIRHCDCKIEYSKYLKRLSSAPVTAVCDCLGDIRIKVDAVSPTLYSNITLQEDNNTSEGISTAYVKVCILNCMCLNIF